MKKWLVVITVLAACWAGPSSTAQEKKGQRPPEVVSPEVSAERKVTFRILAPKAQAIRVTGYLMWDDDQKGSEEVDATISKGFHHPWRSTAWEIHPVIKMERLNEKLLGSHR